MMESAIVSNVRIEPSVIPLKEHLGKVITHLFFFTRFYVHFFQFYLIDEDGINEEATTTTTTRTKNFMSSRAQVRSLFRNVVYVHGF
jgi:hypothetical protein